MATILKIDFGEMARFELKHRRAIRAWLLPASRERKCLRELAIAELPKPLKRRFD